MAAQVIVLQKFRGCAPIHSIDGCHETIKRKSRREKSSHRSAQWCDQHMRKNDCGALRQGCEKQYATERLKTVPTLAPLNAVHPPS
jgi:hypothetical protein